MNSVSIIPARGGSKGLKKKNIVNLNGKPLIEYTINSALNSNSLDNIIISTEDEEIINICKKFENEGIKLIKRPIKLSLDNVSTIDVILHLMKENKNLFKSSTIIVLLQPTSPLRNGRDIDSAINLFKKEDCESLISVSELSHPPHWSLKLEAGYLTPIFDKKYFNLRRQELEKAYIPNGAIFISKTNILKKYKSFYCNKIKPYIMPFERSIDIDKISDLKLAEYFLTKNGQNKRD